MTCQHLGRNGETVYKQHENPAFQTIWDNRLARGKLLKNGDKEALKKFDQHVRGTATYTICDGGFHYRVNGIDIDVRVGRCGGLNAELKSRYGEKGKMTFDDFHDAEAAEKVKRFITSNKKTLIISGEVGPGKTHLTHCVRNECFKQEINCELVLAKEIEQIFHMMESWHDNTSERNQAIADYNRLKNTKLLIVDDLGTESGERAKPQFLTQFHTFLDKRDFSDLKLLVTSNLAIYRSEQYELKKHTPGFSYKKTFNYKYDKAICSRIMHNCAPPIFLKGGDRRIR